MHSPAAPQAPTPPSPATPATAQAAGRWRRTLRITGALLALWFAVTFGIAWFANDLRFTFFGWPFSFWVAAQGAPIVYVLVIVCYAWAMERIDGTPR